MSDVKVPEDLKDQYERCPNCAEEDRTCWSCLDRQILIERIARAEERVEELERERQRTLDLVRYSRHFLFDEKLITDEEYAALVADSDSGERVSRLQRYDAIRKLNAALQREIAALRAPVTDEELTPHLLGKKWPITEAFDALIAARASAQGEKGNGNG